MFALGGSKHPGARCRPKHLQDISAKTLGTELCINQRPGLPTKGVAAGNDHRDIILPSWELAKKKPRGGGTARGA
jgi:hypothetical protein